MAKHPDQSEFDFTFPEPEPVQHAMSLAGLQKALQRGVLKLIPGSEKEGVDQQCADLLNDLLHLTDEQIGERIRALPIHVSKDPFLPKYAQIAVHESRKVGST